MIKYTKLRIQHFYVCDQSKFACVVKICSVYVFIFLYYTVSNQLQWLVRI